MADVDGWTAPGFDHVREVFVDNFESGREIGAGFAAFHRGEKVVDLWGGIADEASGERWTESTLVPVFSTTKGMTAVCANQLIQDGRLDPDAPVAEYRPEFAAVGKQSVTVAHLLSHQAGLAWIDGAMTLGDALAWEPVIEALEKQAPHWDPGTDHGHHATTYGWLIGEVIRRVDGRSVGTYLVPCQPTSCGLTPAPDADGCVAEIPQGGCALRNSGALPSAPLTRPQHRKRWLTRH